MYIYIFICVCDNYGCVESLKTGSCAHFIFVSMRKLTILGFILGVPSRHRTFSEPGEAIGAKEAMGEYQNAQNNQDWIV